MKIIRHLTDATGTEMTMARIELDLPYGKHDRPKLLDENLDFFMKTYSKLGRSAGPEAWDLFFHLTNRFMSRDLGKTPNEKEQLDLYQTARLEDEDLFALHDFYLDSKRILTTVTRENYDKIISHISDNLDALMRKVNLPKKLLAFVVKEDLLYPDLSQIGTRAHDHEDLTFRLPEYKVLTAMSIFCKMMSPIWGDFIFRTSSYIDTNNKESHCLMMITPVLEHPTFVSVHHKLKGYMDNSIASFFKKQMGFQKNDANDMGFTLAHTGFGEDRFALNVYGMLFVKKLALYDPIPEKVGEGKPIARDIMKYIAVNIAATINTTVHALQKSSDTMVRRDPSMSKSEGDKDSTTILESESRVSRITADVPAIVAFGVEAAILRMLKDNNISKTAYDATVAYYDRHLVQISPYTKTILSTFAGKMIGGGKSLQYLRVNTMVKLISLTQLHLANHWPPQFIHLLTATYPTTPKEEMASPVDQRILMTYDTSTDYKQCLHVFPFSLGPFKDIRQQIDDNVRFITEFHHFYNTAPAVTDAMGEENVPKDEALVYDEYIVAQLCEFLVKYGDDVDA